MQGEDRDCFVRVPTSAVISASLKLVDKDLPVLPARSENRVRSNTKQALICFFYIVGCTAVDYIR